MTWYVYALLAILFWSGSDLFSKLASRHDDRYSQLRIMSVLGIAMGLHAVYLLCTSPVLAAEPVTLMCFWYYLPAGVLYIGSMVLGYIGLRYMVLSVSSPICNASGAVELFLCWLLLGQTASLPAIGSALLVTASVVGLAFVESRHPTDTVQNGRKIHLTRREVALGLALPVCYCVLDAAGTLAETMMYDAGRMSEDAGSVTYELMWLVIGLGSLVYLCAVKKQPLLRWPGKRALAGQAVCETLGNYFYIYAIATDYAILAEPMIGCYAVVSVLWARLLLKERLSGAHYVCIGLALVGIALLGWFGA